jgi:hypothetical protein
VAGVTFPITEKFDPLNLGNTDAKMERYTNVEIKHGRVCMIACIGYAMPEFFKFPGCEKFENGLGAFGSLPVEGWVQLIALIGAHEVLVKPREGGMGGSDFGLGTELLTGPAIDAVEIERRQTVERNNGRLAMIGIMGLMVQDGIFGKTPVALLKSDGWWGPTVDWFIKDIKLCEKSVTMCAKKPRTQMRAKVTRERETIPGITTYSTEVNGKKLEFDIGLNQDLGYTAPESTMIDGWNLWGWSTGRRTENVKVMLGEEDYRKSPALPFID